MTFRSFRLLVFVLLNVLTCSTLSVAFAQRSQIVYEPYSESFSTTLDSIPSYHIGEVTILKNPKTQKQSATPFQLFDRNALKNLNALQVSDAVKFFSGVTVKDFGGLGGMKTVSVRGMGAQHTAVVYDGITITDCQTGQIDIGRYSLENVDVLSLNIGDGNTIFQPARMFASSGLLTIRTRRPLFEKDKTFNGIAGFKAGSFGFRNPSLLLEKKLDRNFDLSFSADALTSEGNYPYKLYFADDAYTKTIRSNNDVRTGKVESTLFGHFENGQQLEVKAYYYQSDRGLPGAVILYNPYSSQHLWDRNAFLQAHYEQDLTTRLVIQMNGKYNWSHQRYLNPDYLGSTGKEDNSYNQDESYLSSSLLFKASRNLLFAFSADGAINRMQSNLYGFVSPQRYTGLANISAKYMNDWLFATAGILGTAIHEERASGEVAGDRYRMSPAFSFTVKPFSEQEFHLRMFCKESFRMPSFNDLYYSAVGNSKLKPENSKQLNVGLTYNVSLGKGLPQLAFTSDVYHNRITDKIMAIPTKNIFIWSMVNLGKADIKGLDLCLSVVQPLGEDFKMSVAFNHSYQRALDVTNPASREYRNQIAYAPRVFGSARFGMETPWANVSYAMLYSGHRYVTGQNRTENDLTGYRDHSLSAEKSFPIFGTNWNLKAEILNLLNENYEIVRNFPMPGRSFRLGMKFEF